MDFGSQSRDVCFGGEDNHVEYKERQGTVTDRTTGFNLQFATRNNQIALSVQLGDGNNFFSSDSTNQVNADGGSGDDTLIGGSGENDFYGWAGDDLIIGGVGHDVLHGGDGNDTLQGGNGDDELRPGIGNDSLDGGSGNDLIHIELVGNGDFKLSEKSFAGPECDTVFKNLETAWLETWSNLGYRVDASRFVGPVTIQGGYGDDTLIGGAFDDRLGGYGGNDVLQGGLGNDFLRGGGLGGVYDGEDLENDGNDWLQGDDGDDVLNGGDGQNMLWSGSGHDSLINTGHGDELHWSDPPKAKPTHSVIAEQTPPPVVEDRPVTNNGSSTTTANSGSVLDGDSVIPNDNGDISDSPSPGDILLIGQGIATVGIEDREWAEFDAASSDSAFDELANSKSEGGGDPAAIGDINSTDIGEGLELDSVLSDELVASLAEPLLSDERF